MRIHVPCTALGLALVAIAPAAHAQQAVIAPQPTFTPPPATSVVTEPVRTVRTVTIVRTVRPLAPRRMVRRRAVVTSRTYVSERVVPATTTTTVTSVPALAAAYPAPIYDYATPAPLAPEQPLYDVVQTPTTVAPASAVTPVVTVPAAAPVAVGTAVPSYRYVYQPDRILVVDPTTGIAVQAIPR